MWTVNTSPHCSKASCRAVRFNCLKGLACYTWDWCSRGVKWSSVLALLQPVDVLNVHVLRINGLRQVTLLDHWPSQHFKDWVFCYKKQQISCSVSTTLTHFSGSITYLSVFTMFCVSKSFCCKNSVPTHEASLHIVVCGAMFCCEAYWCCCYAWFNNMRTWVAWYWVQSDGESKLCFTGRWRWPPGLSGWWLLWASRLGVMGFWLWESRRSRCVCQSIVVHRMDQPNHQCEQLVGHRWQQRQESLFAHESNVGLLIRQWVRRLRAHFSVFTWQVSLV